MVQVKAKMLFVARVFGDGAAKTPTLDAKGGSFETHAAFNLPLDLTLLGLLNKDFTFDAAATRPTPGECKTAAQNLLALYAPAQFKLPNASILPDYTAGLQVHVWHEGLHKWVNLGGANDFGTAFELYSGANPYVMEVKVVNGMTTYDLTVGFLVIVQKP